MTYRLEAVADTSTLIGGQKQYREDRSCPSKIQKCFYILWSSIIKGVTAPIVCHCLEDKIMLLEDYENL